MSGIQLETRLPPATPSIVCDADQVQQALVALLVNAVEAMSGGGTLSVEVAPVDGAGSDGAGGVAFTVADSGVGIAPDGAPAHLRAVLLHQGRHSGAGLGLAVVYGIVQRHGGTIDVDSQPGRGTRFRMVLPRQAPGGRPVGGPRRVRA